jgi:hypothetical protein
MITYTKYPDFLIKRHANIANISDDSYEPFQNLYNFEKKYFIKII